MMVKPTTPTTVAHPEPVHVCANCRTPVGPAQGCPRDPAVKAAKTASVKSRITAAKKAGLL